MAITRNNADSTSAAVLDRPDAVFTYPAAGFKHILFPVDFSDRSAAAAPFIEAMAAKYGSRLTLLSVAQPVYYVGMDFPAPAAMDTTEILQELKTRLDGFFKLDGFSENAPAGSSVERIAMIGDPAQVILDYARSHNVDLIMMPTHGYGPFRSLLLGSVTAKVLHDAQCPVWTGAHMEEPRAGAHLPWRTVVCAVDRSAESASLIEWAAQFSREFGASLRLLHAIPGMEGWPSRQMDRQFESDLRAEARRTIERLEISVGVEAPLCVVTGDVAEAVREEAQRHAADVVVIGRGTLNGTLGRLRTHSYAIIGHAPCPVISV